MNENNSFGLIGINQPSIIEKAIPPTKMLGHNLLDIKPRNGKKKPTLIPDDLTIDELKEFAEKLAKENADLKSNKRFGLVWEDIPDEQVDKLNKAIPLLIEDIDKVVVTNENDVNHILINGDNFHALTALRSSHLGKVDVIYIDPPYNTGNKDFIYNDNYVDKEDGYYHSKWLSFMEKRLILAKELLSDIGVIFVSIDDNEQARLKLLMDDIFGMGNFIANIPHRTKSSGKSSNLIASNHDYLIVYANKISNVKFTQKEHNDAGFKFEDEYVEERGKYKLNQTLDYNSLQYNKTLDYPIIIDDVEIIPGGNKEEYIKRLNGNHGKSDWAWRWSRKLFDFGMKNGFIVIKQNKDGIKRIYTKTYLNAKIEKNGSGYQVVSSKRTKTITSLDYIDSIYSNDGGTRDLKKIFGNSESFSYPKSVEYIKSLIILASNPNAIVLDFFAGSGTTAHAVAELNKEDGGNRQCILVTDGGKTETVGQSAKNAKNTTVNIAEEITYERVKRVLTGQNWADGKEHEPLGGNLRYFKIEMENVEGLTTDDQKGLFQHHLINHAMIAENTFIKVLSKQDDLDSLYPQAYNVLTNSDNSKYLVVIEAHDHKLKELKAFLDTIDDNTEVILIGERIDKINWVKNNKGEYRIDTLLDKMIENRLSILNSSVFN